MRCSGFEKRAARGAGCGRGGDPGADRARPPDGPPEGARPARTPRLPGGGEALRTERPPRDLGTESGFRAARGPRGARVRGLGHQKAAGGDKSLKGANAVKTLLETEAGAWQRTPPLPASSHGPRSALRASPGQAGTSGSPAPTLGVARPALLCWASGRPHGFGNAHRLRGLG